MATLDPELLQQYYDSRNYLQAANYLRTIKAKDYPSQQKLNAEIRQLERDDAIQKALTSNLTPEEKEAYIFMQSMNGIGTIPKEEKIVVNGIEQTTTNKYGTKYLNYINNLRSNDGTALNRISVEIDNDDDLELLTSSLGLKNINDNNIGLSYSALSNGKHRVTMNRDNKNLYKLLNAVNNTDNYGIWDAAETIAARTGIGGATGAGLGASFAGVGAVPGTLLGAGVGLLWGANEAMIKATSPSRFKIYGVDPKGKTYSTDEFNYNNIEFAIDEVNKANEIYNKVNETKSKEQNFTIETVATQFLGAGHAEAFKALKQGRIDYDTYNKITKNWEDAYDRLISSADFTKHEVYAWSADSEEGVNLTKVDNTNIPDLKGEVLLAMNDGRVSKSLCIADGEIGTLISITPKTNKKGDWSEAKGEVQKQIFIKGLFEGTAEQAFNADTKTSAARQNADMKKWNYEQRLTSGVTVGYSEGQPYVKSSNENGTATIMSISEEDMLKTLNENTILENSVLEVLSNLDENDELPYQTINGVRQRPTVEQMLKVYSVAATNEIYPKGSTSEKERALYQNSMYNKMIELYKKYYNYQRN